LDDNVFLKVIILTMLLAVAGVGLPVLFEPQPILVGVLHSQTGTMAFSERGVLQATLAAIDDVNAHGGVLGRPLKAVIADGASNEKIFAQQAEHLLVSDKVPVIFGGWTSASRKAMLPVLAAHDGLLFYPVQYEGIEQSANVIYMGMAPNQQLYPALTYMHEHFGKKVLLVGSDYIYPRMANAIARPLLTGLGATICGEVYVPLGSQNVDALVQQVKQCQPDYIVNTVNGDSNLAVFKALRTTEHITPIISMSLSETELRHLITFLGIGVTQAHYVSWGYLQSLDTPENRSFVRQLQMTLPTAAINHPMKVAWDGVHLWANAANLSGVVDGGVLGKNLAGMSFPSASGVVSVDISNRHLWQPVYVARAQTDGSFAVVWQSRSLVAPNPWPLGKDHAAWQQLEQDWYQQWGGQWQAP